MPSGGRRQHNGNKGGRPKGTTGIKHASTLTKEQARDWLREYVIGHMPAMLEAQIAHSQGLKYLVVRDAKTGKFTRITKERMDQLLEANDNETLERLEVWDKDPSVQAFTDLMNRTLDKPKEQEQSHTLDAKIVIQVGKPW